MKYSKALLKDNDIGMKLYDNSVAKSKELLSDIFGLTFVPQDERIVRISENPETKVFEVEFKLSDRTIFATQSYESDAEDLVQEILNISESVVEDIPLVDIPSNYDQALHRVMDILEQKYDLNFTPLDPHDTDKNIKMVQSQLDEHAMAVIFVCEDQEALFTATFIFVDNGASSLSVKQDKQHTIYLD